MAKALLICLIWQFVLVVILVRREQGTHRWPIVREALWLRSPRNPRSGRVGGRVWLIVIPLILLFAAESALRALPAPEDGDLGEFISSDAGKDFLSGAWGWFALIVVSQVFKHGARRGAALSRVPPAAHERRLRSCNRRPRLGD
jgi:hypothetical protein